LRATGCHGESAYASPALLAAAKVNSLGYLLRKLYKRDAAPSAGRLGDNAAMVRRSETKLREDLI